MGNLPVELTRFIGRRKELTEVRRALAARLVTLTGPGGVGKSRVAARAAAGLRRSFEDGVWITELAEVCEPDLLVQTVAATFEVREQIATSPLVTLTQSLGYRRLLLIMDNCEHLLPDCADLCRHLLDACPGLHILATSRQQLDAEGEVVVPLSPLAVPDHDTTDVQALSRYDAVSLFLDRASTVVPDFELSADNQAAVAGICCRLDGLPLAIELAAGRLRALSAEQILDRLADRFRLLTGGPRVTSARQQTLRASIEWSFDLCSEQERVLWARLGVFSGGFQTDAVKGICADERLPLEHVGDLLAGLADKWILLREKHGDGVRYRALETIREFAAQTLVASGEQPVFARRHRDWYSALVETAVTEWVGPRQEYWLGRMEREHPNVRAALEFSLAEPDGAEEALRLLVEPWRIYWWALGLCGEGRRTADRVLARQDGSLELRARAHSLASHLAVYQGEYEIGRVQLELARPLAEESRDLVARSYAAFAAGMYATYTGDLPGAIAAHEGALPLAASLPNVVWLLDHLTPLGLSYDLMGQPDKAIACLERLLAITETCGESFHRSYALWALGMARWQRGELKEATAMEQEGLRIKRAVHDWLGAAFCLESLASIAASGGQYERAATVLGAAETFWRATGSTPSTAGHLAAFHEVCVQQVRDGVGEAAYQAAFACGQALTVDQIFALALQEEQPASPPPSRPVLTRRQQQVAELMAKGLSNQEIADALVISRRTAEGHVDRILHRLGLTSRSQMPAWLLERGQQP